MHYTTLGYNATVLVRVCVLCTLIAILTIETFFCASALDTRRSK